MKYLACAKACAQKKWPVRLAPVPRSLSSGCGTCAYYEGEEKFFYPGPFPEGVESIYKIEGEKYSITPNIEIFNVSIIKGKGYKYVLDNKKLYRITKEFENSNLKLLELFKNI